MYVNVGVKYNPTKGDLTTKSELKRRIAENPTDVHFYSTSDFHAFSGSADDLDIGVKYSVTGPNPYTSRKWYATVEKLPNGKITVK